MMCKARAEDRRTRAFRTREGLGNLAHLVKGPFR